MIPVQNAEALVLLIALVLLGALVHEYGHLLLGKLFGGEPHIDQYALGIFPSRTNYKSPKKMSNLQVRVVGGFVCIFPILAGIGLRYQVPPLVAFGLGGSAISATDLNAAYHPEVWKKLTAGETVSAEDWHGE